MKIISSLLSIVTAVGLTLSANNAIAHNSSYTGESLATPHYGEITETTALDLHVTVDDADNQKLAWHTSHRSHYSHSSHSSHSSHYSSRY